MTWDLFSRRDNLDFRAACNSVALPQHRPLGNDVLARVAGSAEAGGLYAELSATDTASAWQRLVADPRWQLLVEEHAAESRLALDSARTAGGRLRDWFLRRPASAEVVGAMLPSNADRIARVLLASAVGTAGVIGTTHMIDVVAPDALRLPVAVSLPEGLPPVLVAVRPDVADGVLPVRIALDPKVGDITVPIRVQAPDAPITIRTDVSAATLASFQAGIQPIADTLGKIADIVKPMPDALVEVQKAAAATAANIGITSTKVAAVEATVRDGLNAVNLLGVSGEIGNVHTKFAEMAGVVSVGRTLASLVVPIGQARQVSVLLPGQLGQPQSDICDVQVAARDVGKSTELSGIALICGERRESLPTRPVVPGQVVRGSSVPLALVVEEIKRPFLGRNWVRLRIAATK